MKNHKINTIKNGLWNSLANLIGVLTGIAGSVLIVRSLSPEDYGQLSYYIWLFGILAAAGSLAFPLALTKIRSELIGKQQNKQANRLTIFVILLLLVLNFLIAAIIFSMWIFSHKINNRSILLLISLIIVPSSMAGAMRSTLWGSEQYRSVSLTLISASLAQFVGVVFVFLKGASVSSYFIATLTPTLLQFFILGVIVWNQVSSFHLQEILILPDRQVIKTYFAFLLPSTLILLYQTIVWQRSEIFFLSRLSTFSQVGYYNLSFTIYAIFLDFGWALVNGYYPAISRLYGAGMWVNIRGHFQQGIKLAALFAIPVSFGGIATIRWFVLMLYGEKMSPVVDVVEVLLIGLLPGIISGVLNLTLSAAGGIWLHVASGLGISIVNILLDIILIPRYHAIGAAWANTISQISLVCILILLLYRRFHLSLPWKSLASLITGGLLTTLILPGVIIGSMGENLLAFTLAIPLSAVAYSFFIWQTGLLNAMLPQRLSSKRH